MLERTIVTFTASWVMDIITQTDPFGFTTQWGALHPDSMQYTATGVLSAIALVEQTSGYGSFRWGGSSEGDLLFLPDDWYGMPFAHVLNPGVFSPAFLELYCNSPSHICADHVPGYGRESLYWNPGSGGAISVTALPDVQVPECSPVLLLSVGLCAIGALRQRLA